MVLHVIDVVLPVLNEAAAIPLVLTALPPCYRPIVVDNGSTDRSAEIAAHHGATVVFEPRRGFGAACHAGLLAAENEIVCFMDCDGTLDPGELRYVSDPVERCEADLVIGTRQPGRGWSPHARVANAALARIVRRRTGVELRDLGPMRATRTADLLALGLRDRRFGWPLEMVLRAAEAGWRIASVEVSYRERIGRSKVTGTARGTARAVYDMLGVLAR